MNRVLLQLEPLVLFAALYLPSYLAQSGRISGGIFNSITFNVSFWAIALSRIAMILYLVVLRSRSEPQPLQREEAGETAVPAAPAPTLPEYGIVGLRGLDLPWAVVALAAIEACVVPIVMVVRAFDGSAPGLFGGSVHWQLDRPALIPFVLLTCILVGYSEELYFRSYLLTLLPKMGLPLGACVTASVLLFALGHLYEGVAGVLGSAVIALILSGLFLKRRSIHSVALAHGLYNFTTLILTLAVAGSAT